MANSEIKHEELVREIQGLYQDRLHLNLVTHCGICPYVDDGSGTDERHHTGREWTCHGAISPGDPDGSNKVIVLGRNVPTTPPPECPLRRRPKLVVFVPFNKENDLFKPTKSAKTCD